jgi:hypothetical protein
VVISDETLRATIVVTKLDAARRQLRTAIRLWFQEADPASIHTLAHAASEIIHVISKNRNRYRRILIFDADMIKDEYRSEWNEKRKNSANFLNTLETIQMGRLSLRLHLR